jgi:drug/metabolite transporter (DMT)-like permease
VNPATLAGLGAIALWAFLALLARLAAGIPPLQLVAMSFSISAVGGILLLAWRGRIGELRQRPVVWAHGVGGLFGYHALYFTALALAPAAAANLLNYLWPLLIVMFSAALLGLRLRRAHLLGTALAVAGCLLLLGGGARFTPGPAAFAGYLAALGCAVTWALYSVLARRLAGVPTGAVAGFCAATALLAAALHVLMEPTVWPRARDWAVILAMGLGPVGAAFFLWDLGMKRGDPRLLGTLAYATPVASTLLLCAAGLVPFGAPVLAAAALVAAGGLVAARA